MCLWFHFRPPEFTGEILADGSGGRSLHRRLQSDLNRAEPDGTRPSDAAIPAFVLPMKAFRSPSQGGWRRSHGRNERLSGRRRGPSPQSEADAQRPLYGVFITPPTPYGRKNDSVPCRTMLPVSRLSRASAFGP